MPTHAALPAQVGRYRILQKLGEGGMGAVYLAEDTELGRRVALKVPRFTADVHPTVIERFRREARVASAIEHSHICRVYDVGQHDGLLYLAMEYIEGQPLSMLLDPDNPWPPTQAADLVRKVALAVDVIHQRGVMHRDLKPTNIMLRPDGEPVLMDFGLARSFAAPTRRITAAEGALLGTPAYMSPEQVTGDPAAMGPATDIYSLGVILYELLTGQLPFEGPPIAVIANILHAQPFPPSRHRAGLGPAIEGICLKAMAKQVEERFPRMVDFATALQEYVRSEAAQDSPALPPALIPVPPAQRALILACPRCGRKLKLPSTTRGKVGQCPRCQNAFQVPSHEGGLLETIGSGNGQAVPTIVPVEPQPVPPSPQTRRLPVPPRARPVRRANRRPLLLAIGGLAALFLLVACLVGALLFGHGWTEQAHDTRSTTVTRFAIATDKGKEPAAKPGDRFKNSIGMEFVLIPDGTFTMGSPDTDPYKADDEQPPHDVKITKAFYLGIHEVTVSQFREFFRDAPYQAEAEEDRQGGYGFNQKTGMFELGYTWQDPGWPQTDHHPVVNVSWNDAKAFCDWLSRKEGKKYRLPTEAEWEYSCRPKSSMPFPGGNAEDELKGYANLADASFKQKHADATWARTWDDEYPFTAPVGKFKANDFGLFDMRGNVWEWCFDCYDKDYYKNRPNPHVDPQGPAGMAGAFRVLRGGSFYNNVMYCRATIRRDRVPSRRDFNIGFRVVLVP